MKKNLYLFVANVVTNRRYEDEQWEGTNKGKLANKGGFEQGKVSHFFYRTREENEFTIFRVYFYRGWDPAVCLKRSERTA